MRIHYLPLLFLVACGGDPGTTDDNDTVYSVTVVEGHGRGVPPTIHTENLIGPIKLPPGGVVVLPPTNGGYTPPGVDTSCAQSSMRLFSGNNYTGAKICFTGELDLSLADYSYQTCTKGICTQKPWSRNVRSFQSGDLFGVLYTGPYPNFACWNVFESHQTQPNPNGTCIATAERFSQGISEVP
jgi:hypothetical protein